METAGVYDGNRNKLRLGSIEDTLKRDCVEFPLWEENSFHPTYWYEKFTKMLSKVSDQLKQVNCLDRKSEEYKEFATFVMKYLGKTTLVELESDQTLYQPNQNEELYRHICQSHPNVREVIHQRKPTVYPGKLVLFRRIQKIGKELETNYVIRMRPECYFSQHLDIIGMYLEELKREGIDLNDLRLEQEIGHGVVTLIDTLSTKGSQIITLGGAFYGINARTKEIEVYGDSKAIGCSQKVREQMADILREKGGGKVTAVEDMV